MLENCIVSQVKDGIFRVRLYTIGKYESQTFFFKSLLNDTLAVVDFKIYI